MAKDLFNARPDSPVDADDDIPLYIKLTQIAKEAKDQYVKAKTTEKALEETKRRQAEAEKESQSLRERLASAVARIETLLDSSDKDHPSLRSELNEIKQNVFDR